MRRSESRRSSPVTLLTHSSQNPGNACLTLLTVLRRCLWSALFLAFLRIRKHIGELPAEKIHRFMTERVFRDSFSVLGSVLFVTFKTSQCMIENSTFSECRESSAVSALVSFYLLTLLALFLAHGSDRIAWRSDFTLTLEQVAMLKLTLERKVQFALFSSPCAATSISSPLS